MSNPLPQAQSSNIRLAYLASAYPATSHTFILREVLGLRQQGFEIATASINADPRPLERLTEEERVEREHTYVVKKDGIRGALAAHAWALTRHAAGYGRGLLAAVKRSYSPRSLAWNFFHFTEALMLGRWMDRQQITHMHVHFATAAASVASLARISLPITLSMTVHGPDEFANVRAEHFAEKVAACDFIVCISHFARSQTMQHSDPADWHKMSVVRLGVDAASFTPGSRRLSSPESLTLLCVGRLTPAKGQHLLLETLAQIKTMGRRKIRLVLVGDGPDAASLKALSQRLGITELVRFTGALNQSEVRAFYKTADAFVLPSFAEGVPVVLMEAMASGLPCLSTRIAGIPELIEDGKDGLLVPPSDIDALVKQILALADDRELRQRLGQAGRIKVAEVYDLERNVGRLAKVFRQQLAGGN